MVIKCGGSQGWAGQKTGQKRDRLITFEWIGHFQRSNHCFVELETRNLTSLSTSKELCAAMRKLSMKRAILHIFGGKNFE